MHAYNRKFVYVLINKTFPNYFSLYIKVFFLMYRRSSDGDTGSGVRSTVWYMRGV